MASPEIRFKPGKSDYNPDLFDEPVTKIVRLLRQNSHILLKLVGRGDLILGRSRRSDEFTEDTSIDSSEGGLHGDKISGVQRDDFDGNDNSDPADTGGSFLDIHSKENMELESDTLELAKGDLGSKRAMTIRDKMIEMDPAIANQVLIEGSMRSVREVSSKDDHYHVLFIRIDATCLQDYNACPYSQNSESFVDSRSSNSTKCNIGQNTFFTGEIYIAHKGIVRSPRWM